MTSIPLNSISISDFRRLENNRVLPLDAPIVLLHGANGAGKTSVLSALELALTGEIRSMRRHDARYTAHLPFHGQEFATLRVEVSDQLADGREPITMTVGGSRIDFRPALEPEAARFYAERCFLVQVSLGQLLELYQYKEGNEESALARFVNELLGLEQLDALRAGLADATDFRKLKRLSDALADAEDEVRRADEELTRAVGELEPARVALGRSRDALTVPLLALGLASPPAADRELVQLVEGLLRSRRPSEEVSEAAELNRAVIALGGRIEGLSNWPAAMRLEEARAKLAVASSNYRDWRERSQPAIEAWSADAAAHLPQPLTTGTLDDELQRIDQKLIQQAEISAELARREDQIATEVQALTAVQVQLSGAQEQAGALAEGLAAIRGQFVGNMCPVCDRDFGEVSSVHLTDHIDIKVAQLTDQGARLRAIRENRDGLAAAIHSEQRAVDRLREELWPVAEREGVNQRRAVLRELRSRLQHLLPTIQAGQELLSEMKSSQAELDELMSYAHEASRVRTELETLGQALSLPSSSPAQPLHEAWNQLAGAAAERLASADAQLEAHATAQECLERLRTSGESVRSLTESVTRAAERKKTWERRVKEAKRRQAVARAVHEASSKARAAIVQRIFTESLNDVWRDVFTRLAPSEPYVPAFGLPTSSKTALELSLQTIHSSGEPGGSPQMMLSAGNLNTAALSLFIALHLAVEPLVPCLVFDDPVQAMDEVHVAQFAGLIRVLAKHHQRQVIIAVHERELFEYLSLELSPAFKGDELITIDLGSGTHANELRIKRLSWSPDSAIAV